MILKVFSNRNGSEGVAVEEKVGGGKKIRPVRHWLTLH